MFLKTDKLNCEALKVIQALWGHHDWTTGSILTYLDPKNLSVGLKCLIWTPLLILKPSKFSRIFLGTMAESIMFTLYRSPRVLWERDLCLCQSTLGGDLYPEPEYSGRGFWAWARVLWEGVLGLSQSTLGGGLGPEPEYFGRGFWAWVRVLWEGILGLSQSTLGGGFGPEPEYSGRGFWAWARVLWEGILGLSHSGTKLFAVSEHKLSTRPVSDFDDVHIMLKQRILHHSLSM